MSDPIKLPSPRQDVINTDAQSGVTMFTRPWFLFFQLVYQRIGGSLGAVTDDLSPANTGYVLQAVNDQAPGSGIAETQAFFANADQSLELRAEIGSLKDQVAELTKRFNDIQQGTFS